MKLLKILIIFFFITGLSQNFEKFETIKESSKRNNDANSPEKLK